MPPRDPPSDRFLRGKAAAQAAAARARELAEMDRTVDELTPVEHLIDRVREVEAVVVDHASTLAERYEMPHAEAWQRLEARIAAAEARVKVCEDERESRSRWARVARWAKGLGAGSVLAALVWAVTMIGDAGAAREAAARDKAAAARVIEDVRGLRELFAALDARVQILIARMMQP